MPVDFIIGAAVGAAAVSTRVRQAVRKGLIYGVGSVLTTYDKVAAGAQAMARSARDATSASKDVNGAAPSVTPAASDASASHPVENAPAAPTTS